MQLVLDVCRIRNIQVNITSCRYLVSCIFDYDISLFNIYGFVNMKCHSITRYNHSKGCTNFNNCGNRIPCHAAQCLLLWTINGRFQCTLMRKSELRQANIITLDTLNNFDSHSTQNDLLQRKFHLIEFKYDFTHLMGIITWI